MTDKNKKTRTGGKLDIWEGAPPYRKEHYENNLGIPQVVLIPEHETDLSRGIPLSLDLSPMIGHMPDTFQRAFTKALHDQGLIEPADYFKTGAAERYQRALRTVLKHDFLNAQTLAKQEMKNG
jgi:hypothetical protein